MKPARENSLVARSITVPAAAAALLPAFAFAAGAERRQPQRQRLSSKNGGPPVPGASTQQTGAHVADLDGDMDMHNKPYTWDAPR